MEKDEIVWSGKQLAGLALIGALLIGLFAAPLAGLALSEGGALGSSYIIQASDMAEAAARIERVGGQVTHELGVINANSWVPQE